MCRLTDEIMLKPEVEWMARNINKKQRGITLAQFTGRGGGAA